LPTTPKPAIIKLGSTLPSLSAHRGDFEDWTLAGMGLGQADVVVIDRRAGDPLPDPDSITGAVITGSHDMVTDHAPWSEETAAWLRSAVVSALPILGICYGHQLLAYALGGSVGDNPRGLEFGTIKARLARTAATDWLLGGLDSPLSVHAAHTQSAITLPDGARVLASSDRDPHLAFVIGERAWGVQFHPEFDVEVTRTYIGVRREALLAEGQNPEALLKACHPCPAGPEILGRFAQLIAPAGTEP